MPPAWAQSEASLHLSALPVASVVGGSAVVAGSGVALSVWPAALSVGGTVLVVKAVEVSARGSVWVLERASDGMQVSLEVSGQAQRAASATVGTAVTVSVISAGVLLSIATEVVCFIPNEAGRALMHHQRLTP